MNKTVTLEIPQSDWEKLSTELTRAVAVVQEQHRESEERWERIAMLDIQYKKMMEDIRRRLENVDKYLGFPESVHHVQ